MMLTLEDVREEVGVYALKSCTTDGRIPLYVNLAQEELHNAVEQYVGKRVRMRLCVHNNCITWPREIETIEKMVVKRWNVGVRDFWFEFLDYGTGILETNRNCWYNISPDRMDAVTINDIEDNPKFIRVYTDKNEDADAKILFKGGDGFGKQVRTFVDGQWINGEYIGISNTDPQTGTHLFRSIDAVVKPITNGYLSIYSFDVDTNEEEFLALYAPGETRPCYRRSFVPKINTDPNNTDPETTVEIIAIRRFIPALQDTDFLLIPNKTAIKDMVMSILFAEGNDPNQAEIYKARAVKKLQEQYHTWAGTAPMRSLNFARGAYTAAGITNPI